LKKEERIKKYEEKARTAIIEYFLLKKELEQSRKKIERSRKRVIKLMKKAGTRHLEIWKHYGQIYASFYQQAYFLSQDKKSEIRTRIRHGRIFKRVSHYLLDTETMKQMLEVGKITQEDIDCVLAIALEDALQVGVIKRHKPKKN